LLQQKELARIVLEQQMQSSASTNNNVNISQATNKTTVLEQEKDKDTYAYSSPTSSITSSLQREAFANSMAASQQQVPQLKPLTPSSPSRITPSSPSRIQPPGTPNSGGQSITYPLRKSQIKSTSIDIDKVVVNSSNQQQVPASPSRMSKSASGTVVNNSVNSVMAPKSARSRSYISNATPLSPLSARHNSTGGSLTARRRPLRSPSPDFDEPIELPAMSVRERLTRMKYDPYDFRQKDMTTQVEKKSIPESKENIKSVLLNQFALTSVLNNQLSELRKKKNKM